MLKNIHFYFDLFPESKTLIFGEILSDTIYSNRYNDIWITNLTSYMRLYR